MDSINHNSIYKPTLYNIKPNKKSGKIDNLDMIHIYHDNITNIGIGIVLIIFAKFILFYNIFILFLRISTNMLDLGISKKIFQSL